MIGAYLDGICPNIALKLFMATLISFGTVKVAVKL